MMTKTSYRKSHELTPVASKEPAILSALGVALCVAIIAGFILFQLLPATCWDGVHDVDSHVDFAMLKNTAAKAIDAATPLPIYFYGAEDMLFRYGRLFDQTLAWIAVLWKGPEIFYRLIVASDAGVEMLIRALGVLGAAVTAALPVYRHVLFRTPKVRKARYVDGPRVYWFGGAIAKACEYLSPLSREYPGGIELAPGLSVPRKAEYESFFAIGLPGSGKSVVIEGVARQALDRGDRVLYVDVKGGVQAKIAKLVGRGCCAALGLGERCSVWAIGVDTEKQAALGRIVTTLIPESREPIWSSASRLVVRGLINCLIAERGTRWGWRDLRAEISRPVEDVAERLRPVMPQVAEMLRGKGDDPTSMSLSVIFNMVAQISEIVDTCARFETEGRPRFSLTRWARGQIKTRAIVLEHELSDPENSVRLLSVQLRILTGELLGRDVPDGIDHQIWICADELTRFKPAAVEVADLAALGRSRGVKIVASAQSFAQLEHVMTRAGAEALTENFGTIIVCKTRPGRNAENIAANFIGKTTYEADGANETNKPTSNDRYALDPLQMATCLGLTLDWRGRKFIRAAIVGWGDVYVLEWPLDRWKML